MAKYRYILSTKSGIKTEGVMSASTKEAALQKLRKKNRIIISVTEVKYGKLWLLGRPHLSFQDKMLFTKHLTTMVKVGITITEAFEILINQTKKRSIKKMYEDILDMLKSGQSLSKSLRKYSYIFSDLFINMIQTGEAGGNLEEVLEYLDKQLEKDYEIRKKIISAFIYPAVIVGITIVMAIGIVVFIMPKISTIFESFEVDLPAITRFLIGFSKFLTQNPIISVLIVIGVLILFIGISKIKQVRSAFQRLALHIPIFGGILISANIARFARTMNSLLQAGVPITEGLRVTSDMITNGAYKDIIETASAKVEQGGKLGESFEGHKKLFPPLATKMLYIGEKSGSLTTTTQYLAQLFETRVDSKTKNLSSLLEPLLLVVMAVLVGGIAISIILPIYQLPNLLSR